MAKTTKTLKKLRSVPEKKNKLNVVCVRLSQTGLYLLCHFCSFLSKTRILCSSFHFAKEQLAATRTTKMAKYIIETLFIQKKNNLTRLLLSYNNSKKLLGTWFQNSQDKMFLSF